MNLCYAWSGEDKYLEEGSQGEIGIFMHYGINGGPLLDVCEITCVLVYLRDDFMLTQRVSVTSCESSKERTRRLSVNSGKTISVPGANLHEISIQDLLEDSDTASVQTRTFLCLCFSPICMHLHACL